MLMLGGIPWNCYFQRVLACRDPGVARWHSWIAGFLTIGLTIPPLLLGVAAFNYHWPPEIAARLQAQPADALPMVLQHLTPPFVAFLGLAAIVGAVTSSYSASILSASAMLTWNFFHRLGLLKSAQPLTAIARILLVLLSAAAVVLALKVQSVQALWFFTSDLVFVLLFPQLVYALFDRRVNRIGSMVAFFVSLVLRLGGGEPLFHLPQLLPYSTWFAAWLPGDPKDWYDTATGTSQFPVRTLAAAAGMVLLPVVSRLTARWNPPRV
jgi:high affinity choline transporter 7